MFGHGYFGASYFGPSYWGPSGGGVVPVPVTPISPSGGWTRGNYDFLDWHARRDRLRREQEALRLKSRQRKTIRKVTERLAGGLAETMPAGTAQSDIVAAIVASDAYRAAVDALAIKDAARRQAIADYVMRAILLRIMELREEDDAIAVFLLMED